MFVTQVITKRGPCAGAGAKESGGGGVGGFTKGT
jgi:hypothetical protein